MDPTTEAGGVVTPLRVTVGYERKKTNDPKYDNETAYIYLQRELDPDNPIESIKDAMFDAKAAVFEQLGIEAEIVDGIIREIPRTVAAPAPRAESGDSSDAPVYDGPPPCPKCGGGMWDNRKSNAEAVAGGNASASKRPDFKCKNKDGCGEGVWLKKKGR